MSSSEVMRLDSKGRVIIPAGFRDFLRLKPDSEVLLSLDEENARLVLTPTSEKKLTSIKIAISDKPGSLARIAKVLADEGVDLISSESRSLSRGKSAEWRVTCSADSLKNANSLKKKLSKAGATRVQLRKP